MAILYYRNILYYWNMTIIRATVYYMDMTTWSIKDNSYSILYSSYLKMKDTTGGHVYISYVECITVENPIMCYKTSLIRHVCDIYNGPVTFEFKQLLSKYPAMPCRYWQVSHLHGFLLPSSILGRIYNPICPWSCVFLAVDSADIHRSDEIIH